MLEKGKLFIQESIQELKRVNWPSRQETIQLTGAVILVSLAVAVFLGALDFIFSSLLELVL